MFKPIADYMIVEVWEDLNSKIITPDNARINDSKTFIVKATGPGILLEDGKFYKPDIEVNDRVCLVGKVARITPVRSKDFMLARMSDIIAVEKDEPIPDKV